MKDYFVHQAIVVPSGKVKLTKAQAAARQNNIEGFAGRGGTFAVVRPIMFKVGEVFGYDGKLPKKLLDLLEPVDEKEARELALLQDAAGDDDGSDEEEEKQDEQDAKE